VAGRGAKEGGWGSSMNDNVSFLTPTNHLNRVFLRVEGFLASTLSSKLNFNKNTPKKLPWRSRYNNVFFFMVHKKPLFFEKKHVVLIKPKK